MTIRLCIMTFCFCLFNFQLGLAKNDGIKSFNDFAQIPILDNGRLKPLDTFARSVLTQFSGRDHYQQQEAIAWLAEVFFNPKLARQDDVFLINNPDIPIALGLNPTAKRRYTPDQLEKTYEQLLKLEQAAVKIPEKERSLAENEIVRVFDNITLYLNLSHSFDFVLPQVDFTIKSEALKQSLGLPLTQQKFSFMDIALKVNKLASLAQGLAGRPPFTFTRPELELLLLSIKFFHFSQDYMGMSLALIPLQKDKQWVSPWAAVTMDSNQNKTRQLLLFWQTLSFSYKNNDDKAFKKVSVAYINQIPRYLTKDELKKFKKFPLEIFYQASSPFTWSIMLYMLAFICFVVSFVSAKPLWYNLALLSVSSGFLIHFSGLLMRIIIMARPPVSSLYETFVFVALITAILGLLIEFYNRQWLGIITAAISATALLFIANKYSTEGDTLKVLIAVLNSNFWLATHVTTITMGYGATCVGGLLGHIWLIQAIFKKDRQVLDKTYKTILGILGLALTLTFLGTNLGGIWADQSWGRFWGWDPKENGALMIVIWITMLFHAKAGQMIGARGLAFGAVVGMMVVIWAWFGVNLLSVGLHSYGFTSGVAGSLVLYAAVEIFFLVAAFILVK